MGKYFGTDGFRGEANVTLTVDHAFKVGRFLGWYYGKNHENGKAKIVIGKDTRRSSYMFEYSLVAGLTASGADAYLLHVTTTPSVSYVARTEDFDCGIMISASHNPFYDNGIKLINAAGEKMKEDVIAEIEKYLDGELGEIPYATRENIGCTVDYTAGRNRYMGYLMSLAIYSFKGIRVGLDASNGSAWTLAKAVFDALGAKTYVINAALAQKERLAHFGDCVYIFTPLYIANYCENYCVYCGFNCYNHIHRKKLTEAEMEAEMKVIADSGIEEILMLTGESRAVSDVKYIGEACKLARKYFRNIGLEIYPVNTDEYHYLHECGADYITVFQETYNPDKYETLHLMGHKRVWPYRFDAQERALRGGMRGVGFSALLGLDDYHTDALATALHVYYLQRKYPHAEMSISCPRLRPIINNDKINPKDVHENVLCQILCAYRLFLPFAAITVSSREEARFRDGIIRIAATKISAGVSTGIGDHKEKYEAHEVTKIDSVQKSVNNSAQTDDGLACANDGSQVDAADAGDEQFEIADNRSFEEIYDAIRAQGMQPVLNDYLYTEEYHN